MFKVEEKSSDSIFIEMNADTANIELITELIMDFSSRFISEEQAYKMGVAVDEAVTNIIMYAYSSDPEKVIFLHLFKKHDEIAIQIENFGPKFTPPVIVEKKKFSFDKLEEGGLGLYLMQEFMDELRFLYDFQVSKNILVMKKYLIG